LEGQSTSKIKKSMNSKLHLIKVSACHVNSEKRIDLPIKLAATSEVIVTEMEPDDRLYKALEAFIKADYAQRSADMKELQGPCA